MPAAPMMNALRACFAGSERQASAITTALSPLSRMLMTAIWNSATQMSEWPSDSSIPPLCRPRLVHGFRPDDWRLAPTLRRCNLGLRRKAHGEGIADAVGVVLQRDRGLVQRRDVAHDREPQAAALGLRAEQAVEALEHALALLGRDLRPVVAHRNARAALRGDPHRDAPAAPRIADRVVDQVVQKLG